MFSGIKRALRKTLASVALLGALGAGAAYAAGPAGGQCIDDFCDVGGAGPGQQQPGDGGAGGGGTQQPPAGDPQNLVDIFPALLMNFEAIPTKQIHLTGWSDCAGLAIPDEQWCPTLPVNGRWEGLFHKYYVRETPQSDCDAEIVFLKSPNGSGMEIHCAYGDRVAIIQEEMSWSRTELWRRFFDHLGRKGSIWVRRGVPEGQFNAEGGTLEFLMCNDPTTVLSRHQLASTVALYGPWAIDTLEGYVAAHDVLSQFTAPGYDPVEPGWLEFNTQVPGGKKSDHIYIWLRIDGWGPFDGTVGHAELLKYLMNEKYVYGATGTDPAAPKRGLGMIGWGARRNNGDGTFTYLRQAIADRIVVEADAKMPYGVCKNQPTSQTAGISEGEAITLVPLSKEEKRAARVYNYGDLPYRPLSEREQRALERRVRKHNKH